MTKFLFCILAVAAMVAMLTSAAIPEDEEGNDEEDYLNGLILECQLLENTSDADVLLLRQKQMPTSIEAKCLTGCMFESVTFQLNGKLCQVNSELACEEIEDAKLRPTSEECIEKAPGYDKCEDGPLLLACMLALDPEYKIFPEK